MTDKGNWLDDPHWFPDAFDAKANTVLMTKANRDDLAFVAFLDERWDRSGLQQKTVPVSQLSNFPPPFTHPRFIWHTAFCCSTLLARCLDKPGANLSLREPTTLMSVANLKRMQGERASNSVLKLFLDTLGRGFVDNECVTIKPTNIVNNLIGDVMRAHQNSKHVLLISSLKSFIISIAKKGEGGRAFARKLFTIFAMDGHPVGQMDQRQLMQMSDLQIAALVWHMQIANFLEVTQIGGPSRVAWLDGDVFVNSPEKILKKVDSFLELNLGSDHILATIQGPLFKKDSKDMKRDFGPENRSLEAEKVEKSLGDELKAIMDWSYTVFPASPKGGSLPFPL